ncbi:A24 family peptidase [Uliginosibacterium gangwonense]|uniref:A24 family peptidase n=1 Tax=Uliginosibacterium gangwonense TaxID=392736 RepID=UPI000382ED81|nr:prepilin peptidase [Uliginosibacterium gangwonense]
MPATLLAWMLLPLLLVLAVWSDILTRKIPNWLVVCGLISGCACNIFITSGRGLFMEDSGGIGFGHAVLGVLVGGAIPLILYAMRVMGAGDVKLLAAVGAFLGPWQVIGAVLLTFLSGGVLALLVASASGVMTSVLSNLRLMTLYMLVGRRAGFSIGDVETTGRLPYAVAIFCGTTLQILLARTLIWPFT